jgi:formate-dependent nitrite reductase membrane component NrfD
MKSRILFLASGVSSLAALALSIHLVAQDNQEHKQARLQFSRGFLA